MVGASTIMRRSWPPRDEVDRAHLRMTVDARRNLVEADLPLWGDADVNEGDDALITEAIPVDDRLVATDHPLSFKLADQIAT
jgi:hypothetical protein